MERITFFEMAQKSAIYTEDFRELTKPIKENLLVKYNDCKYYPEAVEVRYDKNGKVKNVAILHDLKTNTIIRCELEKVVKYEQERSN